jgi:aminoglycoside phosphotransferase (APT) family kinase protein
VENLLLVVDWMIRFHSQAQAPHAVWNEKQFQRWVRRPLERYRHAFEITAGEARLFAELGERSMALFGKAMPSVWVHWGFEMRNIFRDDTRLTVIDWEGGSPGLPLFDLLYFTTQWYQTVTGASSGESRLRAFSELYLDASDKHPLAHAARRAIAHYVRQLGLDPEFIPLVLVSMWALRAVGRHERHPLAASDSNTVRSNNPYVRYVELLAGSRPALFAQDYLGG